MEIVVSYTRKINHDLYGGNPYESSDHFCSLKLTIDEDVDPQNAHKELAILAKQMVDSRIEEEIMNMTNGLPKKEFCQILDDFLQNKSWGGADDYEKMSDYQKNIMQLIKKSKKRQKYAKEKANKS